MEADKESESVLEADQQNQKTVLVLAFIYPRLWLSVIRIKWRRGEQRKKQAGHPLPYDHQQVSNRWDYKMLVNLATN